jgi:hypothetical protein
MTRSGSPAITVPGRGCARSAGQPSQLQPGEHLPGQQDQHGGKQSQEHDELPRSEGLSLPLRLLALLGAFSFVMLGLSSVLPLLRPEPPAPLPDQPRGPLAAG